MQTVQSLPGISAIYRVPASAVAKLAQIAAISGMAAPIFTDLTEICITGDAKAQCKTETTSNSSTQTATLTFKSTDALPADQIWAFIIRDVENNTWLIGSSQPPFPKISATRSTGSTESEAAVTSYEITHTDIRTMIPCII